MCGWKFNARVPGLLAGRQCGMRELAFGSRKSLQALIAEKIAGSTFTGVGLTVRIERGSITWAIVDVDIASERLAGRQDTAGANPAIVGCARAVTSE